MYALLVVADELRLAPQVLRGHRQAFQEALGGGDSAATLGGLRCSRKASATASWSAGGRLGINLRA